MIMEAEIILNIRENQTSLPVKNEASTVSFEGINLSTDIYDDGFSFCLESVHELPCALEVHFHFNDYDRKKIFVPAVWYNGNTEGEGCYPSSKRSEYWSFIETRMPIPGLIGMKEDDGWTFVWMEADKHPLVLASSGWDKDKIIFRFPGHETPYSYTGKTELVPAGNAPLLQLKPYTNLERRFRIFRSRDNELFHAYKKLITEYFNKEVSLKNGWDKYAASKLLRLLNLVLKTKDGNAALMMGQGNGKQQDVYKFTAGSFLVKSLEAASSFLRSDESMLSSAYMRPGAERVSKLFNVGKDVILEDIAFRIGKYFLSSETSEGFYQDSINLETGERGGYLGVSEHPEYRFLMNARCTGEAMTSYISLYKQTRYRPFLELPIRVSQFYIRNQLNDGSFGRWWDKEGRAIDRKGTNGAYIGVALVHLLPFISNETAKKEARTSISRALEYYTALSLSDDFHGDTLDADSTDKEAGVSILSFLLECIGHGYKGKDTIQAAENAASFILTWIWECDSFIPENSPLGKLSFHTEGMTSVSVAHHHLDFYGMLIALLYLRLWKITGNVLWKNQALKLMNACLSLIASEENSYLGRDETFKGWQPEQINHTAWDYFSDMENINGTFGIDIAWVNVLGYSSYLTIKEEFSEIFNL